MPTIRMVVDGVEQDVDFTLPYGRGNPRIQRLHNFARIVLSIQKSIGFKLSSRGWAYQLEGYRLINKDQFNKVQGCINECRKLGLLPIDFVASETSREFSGVETPDSGSPIEYFSQYLSTAVDSWKYYTPDWWEGEEYYIQMLVEKIDLVTLFEPVCKEYHIPIATSKGWSSILQRADMIDRFKEGQDMGLKPILLYCGDHDPYGLAISDYMKKNLWDLYKATLWDPSDLIIDRFGLNFDFIEENELTWIDNLISGSGKPPDYNDPITADYITKYGERKCEANALVVRPESARDLCRSAIENYTGEGILERFAEKRDIVQNQLDEFLDKTGLREVIDDALEQVDNWEMEE